MPASQVEGVGSDLDVSALEAYLGSQIENLGTLGVTLLAGGRSNPTYTVGDGTRNWILRRPPHGLVLETAHDMAREYRVIKALWPTTVPVPRTELFCDDVTVLGGPFYLMERLEGRTIGSREAAEELNETERDSLASAMVQTLANLHAVAPDEVGLADFGRSDGYLERQVRRWRKQWESAHTKPRPEVDALVGLLSGRLPTTRFNSIVHGDFKTDNLMVSTSDAGQAVGLLDWEMSTLGDSMADVGLMLSFWDQAGEMFNPLTNGITALPGFPSRVELFDRYVAQRDIDGDVDIDWYVSLADLKIAVIFEQIHVRHLRGATTGDRFDGIGDMVGPLLDRALERLS